MKQTKYHVKEYPIISFSTTIPSKKPFLLTPQVEKQYYETNKYRRKNLKPNYFSYFTK